MKISRSRFLLAICAVPLAVLTACGGGSGDNLDDRLNIAEPQLRFVHAIPLGPNLTMTRNGADEGQATNVPYKYASPYFDIRTEDIVLSAMDRVTAGRTAFIITHRPSALKYCNLILRLENGRLSIVSPDASAPAVAVA